MTVRLKTVPIHSLLQRGFQWDRRGKERCQREEQELETVLGTSAGVSLRLGLRDPAPHVIDGHYSPGVRRIHRQPHYDVAEFMLAG